MELPKEVIENEFGYLSRSGRELGSRALPRTACLKVKAFYNRWWLQHHGYSHSKAINVIRSIVMHANKLFGLPGLGTKLSVSLVRGTTT